MPVTVVWRFGDNIHSLGFQGSKKVIKAKSVEHVSRFLEAKKRPYTKIETLIQANVLGI